MHFMVKLGIIAVTLFLASCSSDLPDTPEYTEAKYCKFEIGGQEFCKSLYSVPQELCDDYNGVVVDNCEESP